MAVEHGPFVDKKKKLNMAVLHSYVGFSESIPYVYPYIGHGKSSAWPFLFSPLASGLALIIWRLVFNTACGTRTMSDQAEE